MRAIHMRLSSSFRPILLLDFVVSCSPPRRQFSIPRRLICAAANGGGRSGSIVAAPLVVTEEDFQKKIDVNPPKGTRDFPPEDMRLRNWLFNHFKEVSRLYGFEEVDYPVLETEALFIRKAGKRLELFTSTFIPSTFVLWLHIEGLDSPYYSCV
ncbi:histidine--tRNA ligase, chloroplastic/mitochondrial [Arabidopsis lyrata subsp. lyrata]|uniref:histidine--tRNA ligase, chloroplastic/mitochondrial n=1 Tax=Arabidopsis lyrata subsp. lyrata TaxID=81972 RepID=UPI000A29B114|nr:histidine--tRNA ligase, chloroplastic/mitochondrial [Arabidopsis lyrata subsp. lyrata]|eukprot:XP_020881371.1 histidine--tRNA ligase, chloroplastic/mitochondrial [Arabidopsis lyrata subsp. lyrata]